MMKHVGRSEPARSSSWLSLLAAVAVMLATGGCETQSVQNAPLDKTSSTDSTADRMYGAVAAEHAEQNEEIRRAWVAGGEPWLQQDGPYSPHWEYY